jgi:hypothetical protein
MRHREMELRLVCAAITEKHTDRLSAVGASFNALRRGSRDQ